MEELSTGSNLEEWAMLNQNVTLSPQQSAGVRLSADASLRLAGEFTAGREWLLVRGYLDLARRLCGGFGLGQRHGEDAVLHGGCGPVHGHRFRKSEGATEGAVAAF